MLSSQMKSPAAYGGVGREEIGCNILDRNNTLYADIVNVLFSGYFVIENSLSWRTLDTNGIIAVLINKKRGKNNCRLC